MMIRLCLALILATGGFSALAPYPAYAIQMEQNISDNGDGGGDPVCTESTETDHPACPSGQTGLITRTRTVNQGGACGNDTAWSVIQNTCTTPVTPSGDPSGPACQEESACGTSQGGSFGTPPTQNLCLGGTASNMHEDNGEYKWTCSTGVNPVNCSATKVDSLACNTGAYYNWSASSWTPAGAPNWVVPGWATGPWWNTAQMGQELTVYDASGVKITGVFASSTTKMKCGTEPPQWSVGAWEECSCETKTRYRLVECKSAEGTVYDPSACGSTPMPAPVENCAQLPPQCILPENGECDPRSAEQSFPSSPPNSQLCMTGDSSIVTEAAGLFKWSCSGVHGGQPVDCKAFKGCSAGQLATTVKEIVPLSSYWSWNGCAPGEIDGNLLDVRPDGRHSLGEDGKDKGASNYHLCIVGAPIEAQLEIAWKPGGCPAGWGMLDFYTDNLSNISLNSTQGKVKNYLYCYRATGAGYEAGGKRYDKHASSDAKYPPPPGSARIVNSEGSSSGWYVGSSANDDEASWYVWLYHTRQKCVADCSNPISASLPECTGAGLDLPVCQTKPWICDGGGGGGGGPKSPIMDSVNQN